MAFSILELDSPEWTSRLGSLPDHKRDVHFYPQMYAPYVATYGWAAKAALTVEGEDFIIQPFLLTHDGQMRHAYNFGGPIGAHKENAGAFAQHRASLWKWGVEHSVTSCFITLNPFLYTHQCMFLNEHGNLVQHAKEVVFIDLNNMKLRGTTRRLANKAQGLGAQVMTVSPTKENVQVFNEIYTNTMDRAKAKEYWYTPPKFFQELLLLAGGKLMLVTYKGEVEAGCIIIPSYANRICYYHYAGSYNRYPQDGISHMMVLAAAEFAKSLGCDKLHLGGGVTADPNDGLLTFKAGFSDLRAPVYTYQRSLVAEAA